MCIRTCHWISFTFVSGCLFRHLCVCIFRHGQSFHSSSKIVFVLVLLCNKSLSHRLTAVFCAFMDWKWPSRSVACKRKGGGGVMHWVTLEEAVQLKLDQSDSGSLGRGAPLILLSSEPDASLIMCQRFSDLIFLIFNDTYTEAVKDVYYYFKSNWMCHGLKISQGFSRHN